MSDLDKPLPPSAKKLEDARGEGNIARSNEINSSNGGILRPY